jgi:hypothetical protein
VEWLKRLTINKCEALSSKPQYCNWYLLSGDNKLYINEIHDIQPVRNERGMEEAEGQLKHQHRVYCLGRSPVERDPSERARAQ